MIGLAVGYFLYGTVAVFAVAAAYRIVTLVRMPRHLRWEIYPIPHLGQDGSKYQKVDFARSPSRHAHWAAILFMAEEILLLKKVFVNRRDLWLGSWLLHVGLYLWFLFLGLLIAGAILDGAGLTVSAQSGSLLLWILHRTTVASGAGGFIVGLIGVLLLLWRRCRDVDLRAMSDRVTFLNLFLLLALFGTGLVTWLTADPSFADSRTYVQSLLFLHPARTDSASVASMLFVAGLFLLYLPFSRMFHAVAKYFFYHEILWDDESMSADGPMKREFARYLDYRVTWSAKHVRAQESWVQQVSASSTDAEQNHER